MSSAACGFMGVAYAHTPGCVWCVVLGLLPGVTPTTDPKLSIAEIQENCEAQVLAMSGRAGTGAGSIPKCPACGKGRHSRETCWVLHHKLRRLKLHGQKRRKR